VITLHPQKYYSIHRTLRTYLTI